MCVGRGGGGKREMGGGMGGGEGSADVDDLITSVPEFIYLPSDGLINKTKS